MNTGDPSQQYSLPFNARCWILGLCSRQVGRCKRVLKSAFIAGCVNGTDMWFMSTLMNKRVQHSLSSSLWSVSVNS